jgi:RNA-directed DNA polymerase
LEFDVKGLFDNIDHELLLRAVRKHVKCKWALLYIERWLAAPMEREDGTVVERKRGTPQGGVVSPILSNLFMHYAFDLWMTRTHPDLPWCRYADDGLVHCRTEQEAEALKLELQARLAECRLEMHPTKTVTAQVAEGSGQAQVIDQLCRVGCQGLEQIPALLSGGRDQRSDNSKVRGALL